MADFSGKIVLVTGGSSGIGAATATAFARAGARVIIAARRGAPGELAAQAIREAAGDAAFLTADVTREAAVVALIRQIVATYGRLDIAFNCAGTLGTFGPIFQMPETAWREVLDGNLTGTFLCMKHEIGQMLQQRGGVIVNVTATAGQVGLAYGALYSAAKYGVAGLTRSAALEYAKTGIRVNAVMPGFVDTPGFRTVYGATPEGLAALTGLLPQGRLNTADEIAPAVLFLASDAASAITGAILAVDGGYTAQ